MKKIICGVLVVFMMLAFAACSAENTEQEIAETVLTEPAVLESPPDLTVTCGKDTHTVQTGNYSWTSPGKNGEMSSVIACGNHPLDVSRIHEFRSVTGDNAMLSFTVEPDTVTVVRWPQKLMGSTEQQGQEVEMEGLEFSLEEGSWIYLVTASWNGDTWSGEAEYHLYLTK